MADRKGKSICLSSSSEDQETDDDILAISEAEDDDEEELVDVTSGDDDEKELVDVSSEDDDDESDADIHERKKSDADKLIWKVMRFLEDGKDLNSLSLKDCKAYLWKYGLRRTGTKTVCIHRIKEHWSLKDGNGESHYPRSSFVINCKGDVCRGDIVLFTQNVFAKFDKVTRHGGNIGRRTIAGRVVKESYGADKQQHTFTIEVLWSRGTRALPPLFPLLIKGRNLYKRWILRQIWDNEAERRQILDEKHKRGATARAQRRQALVKKRERGVLTREEMKRRKRSFSTNGATTREGAMNQMHSHLARQTLMEEQQNGRKIHPRRGRERFKDYYRVRNNAL